MTKTSPLSLMGLQSLLTSLADIAGITPTMTLKPNGELIMVHFLGENVDGKIDIKTDKTLTKTDIKVVVADEHIADALETALGEFGFELPTDFGLGSTIDFGLTDDIMSTGVNIDTIRHDAADLADGIEEIVALAKTEGDGTTDHFDAFMMAMGYSTIGDQAGDDLGDGNLTDADPTMDEKVLEDEAA